MKALGQLYAQQFKTTFAGMLQYRAALAIWLISHVLEPVVYLVVWSKVAAASGGQVGDYNTGAFAAYFLVLMLVNHVTFSWIMYEFEYRIRHGSLSRALLRPVHPIHSDIADNVAYKLITLPVMLLIAGVLAIFFHPVLSPPFWSIALAIPALVLAFVVRFFFDWTLALVAFWTTRVGAFNQVYFVLVLFLSGQMAPLSLFPPVVQVIATVLPFRWMIGFPVELLLGRLTQFEAFCGIGVQVIWVIAGLVLLRFVWRAGVRTYSAVGA